MFPFSSIKTKLKTPYGIATVMDSNEFQEQSNHGVVVEFQNNIKGHLSPANDHNYTIMVETDSDFKLFSNNWDVDVKAKHKQSEF